VKQAFGLNKMMLPPDLIEKATLRGHEYAWSTDSFIEALHRAAKHGLGCVGGQFQFRIADGPTCEMYWIEIDTGGQNLSESWDDYVKRSTQEVETKFNQLIQETDFQKEAESWNFSEEIERNPSFNPLDHLCFVAYFESETN
jgi:hypothetical protein